MATGLRLRGGRRQQALGLHPAVAVLQHGPQRDRPVAQFADCLVVPADQVGAQVGGRFRRHEWLPPGAIDADTCAGKIIAAVRRGKRVASFPRSTSWMVSLARFLPPLLYDRIMTRMAARIKLPY